MHVPSSSTSLLLYPLLLVAAAFFPICSGAKGTTYIWVGAQQIKNWCDPANWEPSTGYPGKNSGDIAVLNETRNNICQVSGCDVDTLSLDEIHLEGPIMRLVVLAQSISVNKLVVSGGARLELETSGNVFFAAQAELNSTAPVRITTSKLGGIWTNHAVMMPQSGVTTIQEGKLVNAVGAEIRGATGATIALQGAYIVNEGSFEMPGGFVLSCVGSKCSEHEVLNSTGTLQFVRGSNTVTLDVRVIATSLEVFPSITVLLGVSSDIRNLTVYPNAKVTLVSLGHLSSAFELGSVSSEGLMEIRAPAYLGPGKIEIADLLMRAGDPSVLFGGDASIGNLTTSNGNLVPQHNRVLTIHTLNLDEPLGQTFLGFATGTVNNMGRVVVTDILAKGVLKVYSDIEVTAERTEIQGSTAWTLDTGSTFTVTSGAGQFIVRDNFGISRTNARKHSNPPNPVFCNRGVVRFPFDAVEKDSGAARPKCTMTNVDLQCRGTWIVESGALEVSENSFDGNVVQMPSESASFTGNATILNVNSMQSTNESLNLFFTVDTYTIACGTACGALASSSSGTRFELMTELAPVPPPPVPQPSPSPSPINPSPSPSPSPAPEPTPSGDGGSSGLAVGAVVGITLACLAIGLGVGAAVHLFYAKEGYSAIQ
eukprot:NODE_527_length_2141_cov_13.204111_g485_i0.p1 GENE.NODE_527_length_2141_cov_13.204111_g485_i0~~NODE_527_length_2141_cov_13.204111_g485_i0.p1  ORF type:complete len:653 (+),score=115.95 NODE_527_length_2141_cov_13.204111_g485_i0:100-2058(+)